MAKQQKKLRILISSNAPWAPSGYGQQLAELLPHIVAEGYPVAISAFYGLQGAILDLGNVKYYPAMEHAYGSDALVYHSKDFQADVSFTFQDTFVLHPNDLQQVKRLIPIAPIDHDPVDDRTVANLKLAYRIVTYSQYGEKQLKSKGLHSTYIPHTVDTEVFKPLPKEDRDNIRKSMGVGPSTMLFGMVAANKEWPPRKSFQEALDAFKLFHDKHPNSMFYFHANPQFPGGFPIDQYARYLGISDRVIFPHKYEWMFKLQKPQMAQVYNAFDCLLLPSKSEGFGVPLIEAQACGVPVITNRFTSMTELVEEGRTGYAVSPIQLEWDQLGSYRAIADTKKIYESMEKLYKADRKKMGEVARNWMVRDYDTATVYKERWSPFLAKLEKEIYPPIEK